MFTGDTVDTQAAKPIGFASSGSQLVVNVNPSNFKDDASMNEDRDPWGVRVVGRWWGIPTITPSVIVGESTWVLACLTLK